ncbi:MAG: EAL domain-containing protein [Betaproteobacteria bacterium]|nr:EAL domain-containing protein [Betaproteobacteria bacterium]
MAPLGCRIGVEHLDKHIGRLGRLSALGLSYLKVNHSLVKGISQDSSGQTLLRGLCTIGHTMGLTVIGEGVSDAADMELLFALGFDGLTGSAVR